MRVNELVREFSGRSLDQRLCLFVRRWFRTFRISTELDWKSSRTTPKQGCRLLTEVWMPGAGASGSYDAATCTPTVGNAGGLVLGPPLWPPWRGVSVHAKSNLAPKLSGHPKRSLWPYSISISH